MNIEIEKEIIKFFFLKNKQERLIWELSDPGKRKSFRDRIAHPTLFDERYLYVSEMNNMDCLKLFLQEKSRKKEIYMIGESHIGEITIDDAIALLKKNEICILYCGNGVGYYQPEEDYGHFEKYILRRE